jgi:hypothetical protein
LPPIANTHPVDSYMLPNGKIGSKKDWEKYLLPIKPKLEEKTENIFRLGNIGFHRNLDGTIDMDPLPIKNNRGPSRQAPLAPKPDNYMLPNGKIGSKKDWLNWPDPKWTIESLPDYYTKYYKGKAPQPMLPPITQEYVKPDGSTGTYDELQVIPKQELHKLHIFTDAENKNLERYNEHKRNDTFSQVYIRPDGISDGYEEKLQFERQSMHCPPPIYISYYD